MEQLRIDQWGRTGRHIIALTGELWAANAFELETLIARLDIDGAQEIELDLRDLSYIDGLGLATLFVTGGICADAGIAFRVLVGTGAAFELLALTGMLDVLPVGSPIPG
jgi:anti-anti-sigma factor